MFDEVAKAVVTKKAVCEHTPEVLAGTVYAFGKGDLCSLVLLEEVANTREAMNCL